jgi:hypothetical protein
LAGVFLCPHRRDKIDIETSPITGLTWGVYEQNLLKVIEPSKIMSMAWKWLGERPVQVKALPDYRGYKAGRIDDEALVREVWSVLDEADIVIAHNGDSFDVKKLNARFVFYRLGAPSNYKQIDTKKVAKRYFRFDSNKLDWLGDYLGEGRKVSTGGFDLWNDCMAGDLAAWGRMKRYNVGDINLLEKIYLRLRPFMADHPNTNLMVDKVAHGMSCPTCRSTNVQARGYAVTKVSKRQRYQCMDCASWSNGPIKPQKIGLR